MVELVVVEQSVGQASDVGVAPVLRAQQHERHRRVAGEPREQGPDQRSGATPCVRGGCG